MVETSRNTSEDQQRAEETHLTASQNQIKPCIRNHQCSFIPPLICKKLVGLLITRKIAHRQSWEEGCLRRPVSSSKELTGYRRESRSGSVHPKFGEKEALSCFELHSSFTKQLFQGELWVSGKTTDPHSPAGPWSSVSSMRDFALMTGIVMYCKSTLLGWLV